MLVHHCTACNFNTPVAYSASVFSQNQYCNHCSALSQGVVLRVPAIESNLSRQLEAPHKEMQQQDELARLFAQNMNFGAPTPPPEPSPTEQQHQPSTRPASEPITYITQHYTHSAHVTRPRETSPPLSTTSSSTNNTTSPLSRSDLERHLAAHGVDASLLFPSQLTLFQHADLDQRLRLLELWRICPPTVAEHERAWDSGAWPETSLQQEEDMARVRYDQLMDQRRQQQQRNRDSTHSNKQAEPYMASGYEALARRDYEATALQETTRYNQATDRAYFKPAGYIMSGGDGQQDMENQYGAYEAMRHAETAAPAADEDMVM